ncbi:hypothetical protein [Nostoc sp.]|uniref:hypothetical protein n=1 Tax=Nostoc sp. TaxID=1180 RepID=UPI002FFA635E
MTVTYDYSAYSWEHISFVNKQANIFTDWKSGTIQGRKTLITNAVCVRNSSYLRDALVLSIDRSLWREMQF